MARAGAYRDETWRLALARDAAALHAAADLLLEDGPDESRYDGHRARAFALSVEGRVDDALDELNDGATEDWPFPAAYAADVGRVRYLAGEYSSALSALQLAVDGADRLDPAVGDLVAGCVRGDGRLLRRGLAVAVGSGTTRDRVTTALAVIKARLGASERAGSD
jgi:hypothetical protein